MDSALDLARLQFAFTASFHYVFVQLTLGLGPLIVFWETLGWWGRSAAAGRAARFWVKAFALSFTFGVVTGLPLEFQFGTNWAAFSKTTGPVVGQTLALEGLYAFILESAFLGIFLYGRGRIPRFLHWLSAILVVVGSWLSSWFILATNAFMQHPQGFSVDEEGIFRLESLRQLLFNPWLEGQLPHTLLGGLLTGAFVVAGISALWTLNGRHSELSHISLKTALPVGLFAALLLAFPTGDRQAQMVARHQPASFAAMEGHFETENAAAIVILGQPDMENLKLDNPLEVPGVLSFLTHKRWAAEVQGLKDFPREEWPDHVPLLYYSYHIMVGLGTLLIAVLAVAMWSLVRGRILAARRVLWILLLAWPFPFLANTAGWVTAELGRQPWLVYGLLRTQHGPSPQISAGNVLFTLMGFLGLYLLLGILFLAFFGRIVVRGPKEVSP